jgi:C1A family cysteine protease
VFKNSYGPTWGEGGYGWVTCRYLQNYLLSAALLEVQRPDAAK